MSFLLSLFQLTLYKPTTKLGQIYRKIVMNSGRERKYVGNTLLRSRDKKGLQSFFHDFLH